MNSRIKEINSFAKGVIADYQAIKNAVKLHWNNESLGKNVNQLNTIQK